MKNAVGVDGSKINCVALRNCIAEYFAPSNDIGIRPSSGELKVMALLSAYPIAWEATNRSRIKIYFFKFLSLPLILLRVTTMVRVAMNGKDKQIIKTADDIYPRTPINKKAVALVADFFFS